MKFYEECQIHAAQSQHASEPQKSLLAITLQSGRNTDMLNTINNFEASSIEKNVFSISRSMSYCFIFLQLL